MEVQQAKPSQHTWAITLFAIGIFMAQLDNGIISAALSTINRSFDVDANWGAWGITIYTLGLAISLPIVGKLSDRYGRKKLFIVEIALFGIGSFLVALSPNFAFYIISRFIQSLGGGGIFIIGSSHVLTVVEPSKQGKYLGLLGGMNGVAAVLGPNIGSFILDLTGSWHVLFLINVPIAIALVIFGFIKLENSKDPKPGRLDLVGTIILSFSILAIMYGLTNIDVDILKSLQQPNVWGFMIAGIILFAGLLTHEGKLERNPNGDPILSVKLLKQPRYLMVLLIGALSGGLLASMIYIPSFTEQVLGITAENSGYWMTPLALTAGIGAGLGGAFVDRKGPIFAVVLSGVIGAIGFMLFPLWLDGKMEFIVASSIAGVGIGIILGAPLNILSTEGLTSDKGSAVASLSLARQIGMTIAPTIYAGFLARAYNNMDSLFANDFQDILQKNIEKADLSTEAMQELGRIGQQMAGASKMSESQINKIVGSIQDPGLKDVIYDSVNQLTHIAAQNGFDGLYWTAAIIGLAIVLLAFVLSPLRKNFAK
ncbi:MFS transporter [Bacillus massilinigeriensis]|uniref:MFS transporter n=1 Tax=Bacillus massilionigeriensis TaxID=1805475 RepID=UPI00096B33EB|nr:MFS transporter [Bacillus massilionigeriensis]